MISPHWILRYHITLLRISLLTFLSERFLERKKYLIWLVTKNAHFFFNFDVYKNYNLWFCQKICEAFVYLLDNIFIRFGTKVYRQTIGIPMGTNCAPLVADLFLLCYERGLMKSLSRENQTDIIEAFNSTP